MGAEPHVPGEPLGDHGGWDLVRLDPYDVFQLRTSGERVHRIDQAEEELVLVAPEPEHVPSPSAPMDVVVAGERDDHVGFPLGQPVLDEDSLVRRRPSRVRRRPDLVAHAGLRRQLAGEQRGQVAGDRPVLAGRSGTVRRGAAGQEEPIGAVCLGTGDLLVCPELHRVHPGDAVSAGGRCIPDERAGYGRHRPRDVVDDVQDELAPVVRAHHVLPFRLVQDLAERGGSGSGADLPVERSDHAVASHGESGEDHRRRDEGQREG